MEKLLSDQEPAVGESSASWSNPNPNPTSVVPMDDFDWSSIRDDDIMQQHSAIRAEEAVKVPFVGDKEPLSSLAAEFQSGNPILKEKIKLLGEQYGALRRTRGDGNCFYRSFMFSYLEHILETQDKVEVDRILENIEECKKTLQGLGYIEFTFEDFFSMQSSSYFFCHYQVFCWFLATSSTICICRCILHAHEIFIEQLESVLQGDETSISHEELLQRSRDQMISDYVVMFFRFVTSGEIRKRSEFFEPFIAGLTNSTVDQFCKASVEPMGEESDHVHITALSDALGVPIRVVYLDRSSCDSGTVSINHHDFVPSSKSPQEGTAQSSEVKTGHPVTLTPTPFVTLLYRPGHYDILYPK